MGISQPFFLKFNTFSKINVKRLEMTFEFHRQIFNPNLAQTIISLKTIDVIPF